MIEKLSYLTWNSTVDEVPSWMISWKHSLAESGNSNVSSTALLNGISPHKILKTSRTAIFINKMSKNVLVILESRLVTDKGWVWCAGVNRDKVNKSNKYIHTDGTIHNFFGMESLRRHKFSHEIHFSDSVNDSCIHV